MDFDLLMYVNIKLTTKGFQQEKTEPICAHGLAGQPRSLAGWPHFGPKNSGIFPKFSHKSLNSFIPLNLEIWKENFENGKS
jgi:hypothetical protein